MAIKAIVALGIALTVGAWVLVVPYAPEPAQSSRFSSAQFYRDLGTLPAAGSTIMSAAIGHEVFEEPASDRLHLQQQMATMGMATDDGDGDMPMESPGAAAGQETMAEMPAADHAGERPEEAGSMAGESSMAMQDDDHQDVEAGHDAGEEAGHRGGGGLSLMPREAAVDRTVAIGMDDWGYDVDHAMVMAGETVRLVITNNGNTPHEFMLMTMAGMQAVDYRIQRADWNLLEHEALFEVPVLMPGDTTEAVIRIEESGMWMFMCMFPYHMQFGMMGMMMTPDQMGMGGMNM